MSFSDFPLSRGLGWGEGCSFPCPPGLLSQHTWPFCPGPCRLAAQSLRTGPSTPPGEVSRPPALPHPLPQLKSRLPETVPAPLLPTADAQMRKCRQRGVKSFEDRTGFEVSVGKPNLVRGQEDPKDEP